MLPFDNEQQSMHEQLFVGLHACVPCLVGTINSAERFLLRTMYVHDVLHCFE